MKNNTIPILYHGGCYGTYLEWVLSTLTDQSSEITNPLTKVGNSHNFQGNHVMDIEGWRQYLAEKITYPFVRFHPKLDNTTHIFDNLLEIEATVDQYVYVYPDEQTLLLCLSNQFSKIWKNWWKHEIDSSHIVLTNIRNNWPIDPGTDVTDLPRWVQREFLSFYLMPMWFDQIEWSSRDQIDHHTKCLKLSVYDLLFDFKPTIAQLIQQLKLTTVRQVEDLLPIHNEMISLQKNLGVDQLCNNIVSALMNNQFINWEPLSIVAESWIQWQLRNMNYEIRCDGLDIFPTNSVQLKELIYKA